MKLTKSGHLGKDIENFPASGRDSGTAALSGMQLRVAEKLNEKAIFSFLEFYFLQANLRQSLKTRKDSRVRKSSVYPTRRYMYSRAQLDTRSERSTPVSSGKDVPVMTSILIEEAI